MFYMIFNILFHQPYLLALVIECPKLGGPVWL